MKRLVQMFAAFGVAALLSHCGLSPQQACKAIVTESCKKLIECTKENAKKFLPFLKDQATCEAELFKRNNCDDPNTSCKDGKTYDPVMAGKCVNEYKALQCSDFPQYQGKVPSCDQVCK